jgi:hypothetical protein
LPVAKADFFVFLDVWKLYDREGTGYIDMRVFDDFLQRLSETDAGFFKFYKESMSEQSCREAFSLRLELPTHLKF